MAELTTIARPYARAAFQFALEHSALDEWFKQLGRFALIAAEPAVKSFLSKPELTPEKKVQLFTETTEQPLSDSLKNLLLQLAGHKRLEILPAVFVLFESLLAEHQKTISVDVISAFELSDAELERLGASLKTRLGRDVKLQSSVNQDLIGGVVIRAGDLVIDASVKGKLTKLTNELNT